MKISLPEKFLRWQLGTSLLLALGAEDQKCSKYKSLAKTLVQMKSTYQFCFCAKDQNKFEAYVVKMSNRKWKLYKDKVTAVYKFTFFLNFISFQVVKRCTVITSKIIQRGLHYHFHILTIVRFIAKWLKWLKEWPALPKNDQLTHFKTQLPGLDLHRSRVNGVHMEEAAWGIMSNFPE